MVKLTVEQANEVYSLLVQEAGAHEYYRDNFVGYLTQEDWSHEYRFMGIYGSSGKLRLDYRGLSAYYHQENRTSELDQKIKALNSALSDMWKRFKKGGK